MDYQLTLNAYFMIVLTLACFALSYFTQGHNEASQRARSTTSPETPAKIKASLDTQIAALVRRTLRKAGMVSGYGFNVRIITQGDTLTLRGSAASYEEMDRILSISRAVAGHFKIVNHLQLPPQAA